MNSSFLDHIRRVLVQDFLGAFRKSLFTSEQKDQFLFDSLRVFVEKAAVFTQLGRGSFGEHFLTGPEATIRISIDTREQYVDFIIGANTDQNALEAALGTAWGLSIMDGRFVGVRQISREFDQALKHFSLEDPKSFAEVIPNALLEFEKTFALDMIEQQQKSRPTPPAPKIYERDSKTDKFRMRD